MPTEREVIEAAKVLKEWCRDRDGVCYDETECIFSAWYGCCLNNDPEIWHIPETGEEGG